MRGAAIAAATAALSLASTSAMGDGAAIARWTGWAAASQASVDAGAAHCHFPRFRPCVVRQSQRRLRAANTAWASIARAVDGTEGACDTALARSFVDALQDESDAALAALRRDYAEGDYLAARARRSMRTAAQTHSRCITTPAR